MTFKSQNIKTQKLYPAKFSIRNFTVNYRNKEFCQTPASSSPQAQIMTYSREFLFELGKALLANFGEMWLIVNFAYPSG